MKKLITLLTMGLCASAIFAQEGGVNVSGYGTSYFTPFRTSVPDQGDTSNTAAVQAPWGEPNMSAGISFNGWSEFAGFNVGFDIAYGMSNEAGGNSSVKAGYTINAFLKPLEQLKLIIGNNYEDIRKLMGKIGGSNFAYYVLDTSKSRMEEGGGDSANNIFTQINSAPWGSGADAPTDGIINNINLYSPEVTASFMAVSEPIDGLWLGAMVMPEISLAGNKLSTELYPNPKDPHRDGQDQDYHNAAKVYENIIVAAGYNIPGIGLLRAQYIGFRKVVEVAFQVLALGDLMMDIGAKIPLKDSYVVNLEGDDYDMDFSRDYQVSIGATYRYYEWGFSGHIDSAFGGYYKNFDSNLDLARYTNGLDLVVYLTPTYEFSFAKMGLDLGFEYMGKAKITGKLEAPTATAKDGMQAGVGLWLERKFGSGTLRGGLASRFPLEWTDGTKQPFELFIPLRIEVGF